jgi:hypothetical protein
LWDSDRKEEQKKYKNTNDQQLFLETKNKKIRSSGKMNTPTVKEGHCNETTHSGPSTHSQSHQPQNISENTEVKQRMV